VFKCFSDLWQVGDFCFCYLADTLASSSHNIDGYDKIDILSEAAFNTDNQIDGVCVPLISKC
jgi:hypothetical protein